MSPEAQRIAIAEACGWGIANPGDKPHYQTWVPPGQKPLTNGHYTARPPDYLSDLNAMHEAEEKLDEDELERYAIAIFNKLTAGGRFAYRWPSILIRVGADVRAEAFLRTLGKWEDGK